MALFGKPSEFSEYDFKILFEKYYKQIKNFLFYKSGNTALSEDLAQNSFLTLWENRKSVKPETASSYLYKIAENLFLNEFKHQKVIKNFELEFLSNNILSESPEFILEEKEFEIKLNQIISSIPEKSRTVFLMNRIDKLTYSEIAERTGISEKAVEKRMQNALQILKEFSLKI